MVGGDGIISTFSIRKKFKEYIKNINYIVGCSDDASSETKSFLKGILSDLMVGGGSIISTFSIRKKFKEYIKNINYIVGCRL